MQKGIENICYICYGNHPKSVSLYPVAHKVLELLKENGEMEIRELAKKIGLKYDNYSDKTKFYTILRPLYGRNPLEIQFIAKRRSGNKTFYYLSKDLFGFSLNQLKKRLEYHLEGGD